MEREGLSNEESIVDKSVFVRKSAGRAGVEAVTGWAQETEGTLTESGETSFESPFTEVIRIFQLSESGRKYQRDASSNSEPVPKKYAVASSLPTESPDSD